LSVPCAVFQPLYLPNSDATDKDIQRGTIPELMEPNLPLAITRVY
jgi:hypothetical protein